MRKRTSVVLMALLGVGGFAACGGGIGAVAPIEDPDAGDAAGDGSVVADAGSADADASAADAGPEPAGVVDTAFGDGGRANVPSRMFDDYETLHCVGATGGRLLFASQAVHEGTGPVGGWAAALTTGGQLDTSFAAPTGKASLGLSMTACVVDAMGRVVASVDGKIKRWSPQGVLDVAFSHDLGSASLVVTSPAGGYVTASALQAGSMTVTWIGEDGSTSASTVVQLTGASGAPTSAIVLPSGALLVSAEGVLAAVARTGLDPAFGSGGRVAVSGHGLLALDPHGQIVLVHTNQDQVGNKLPGVRVERFTVAGARVADAQVAAVASYGVPPGSILVQPDGKLLVAGQGSVNVVFRLLPDASLDPAFGDGGVVGLPLHASARMFLTRVTDTSFAVVGDDRGIGVVLVR